MARCSSVVGRTTRAQSIGVDEFDQKSSKEDKNWISHVFDRPDPHRCSRLLTRNTGSVGHVEEGRGVVEYAIVV